MASAQVDQETGEESSLPKTFQCATEFVQNEIMKRTQGGNKPNQEVLLQIYGLYKTATEGKCTKPKPGIFDPTGRAKWYAWNQVLLSKEDAMKAYIELAVTHFQWDLTKSEDSSYTGSGFGGNSVSTFAVPTEEEEDTSHVVISWIKDNKRKEVEKWINEGNNINFQDNDGLTLLHWAVDRGHEDLVKFLLDKKVDTSIKDSEGLTSLDYAITCEHDSIVELLQNHS